jgi:hypothetical protein
MKPTAELRRHVDVEPPQVDATAFRPGWLVSTRIDQLLAAKRINRAQWQAAIEFRVTWGISREPKSSGLQLVRSQGASRDDAMLARLRAETIVRNVTATIGPLATALVVACVIEDLAWAAIARKLGRNPETVRDWTVLSLRALCGAWEGATSLPRGRPAIPSRPTPQKPPTGFLGVLRRRYINS